MQAIGATVHVTDEALHCSDGGSAFAPFHRDQLQRLHNSCLLTKFVETEKVLISSISSSNALLVFLVTFVRELVQRRSKSS